MIRWIQEKINSSPGIILAIDSILIGLAIVALGGVVAWLQMGQGTTEPQMIDEAFTINFESDSRLPYVGSVSGEKYYPAGCKGVSRIKPENRIYFSSVIEAVGAGYSAASGC